MKRIFCDDCGEELGGTDRVYPRATLPGPFPHPEYGSPFRLSCDFCAFCCGGLLEAYANRDNEQITRFWNRISGRRFGLAQAVWSSTEDKKENATC